MLLNLLETDGVFRKVSLLHDLLHNGILDYMTCTGSLQLNNDVIRPAIRVSLLLNYLTLVVQNTRLQLQNQDELQFAYSLFKSIVQPYAVLLDEWLNQGTLNDRYGEFFVVKNERKNFANCTQKECWQKAYVIRSVNFSEIPGVNLSGNEVELAVPNFLRPHVQDILSIGKSVSLIKQLDPKAELGFQSVLEGACLSAKAQKLSAEAQ
jgi:hypothetical protein